MNNLTGNTNLLSNAGFKLIINSQEFSNTGYFAVTANIPSVQVNAALTTFKNQKGYVPGETIEFEQFSVRIAIDEDLVVYKEIFNWMKTYTDTAGMKQHDMSLIILSSHNNPNKTFKFVRAFPVSLGSIEFNAQNTDAEYAFVDVQFQYDYFLIEDEGIIC
jgi:hypothetical protein